MSSGCVWSERNCACCGPLRSLQTPARRLTGIVEPLLRVATKIAGVRLHELDHNGLGILQSPEPSGAHEDIPQTERESLVQCPQPPLPSHLRVLLKVVEYLKVLADKVLRLRDEAGSVAQRGAGVTMPTTSRAAQRTCNLRLYASERKGPSLSAGNRLPGQSAGGSRRVLCKLVLRGMAGVELLGDQIEERQQFGAIEHTDEILQAHHSLLGARGTARLAHRSFVLGPYPSSATFLFSDVLLFSST